MPKVQTKGFERDPCQVSYVFNLQNNDTAFWERNHFTAAYLGPGAPIHDRFLGDYMSRSWASFIATGDPNNANLTSKVYWPPYAEGAKEIVFETSGSYVRKDVRDPLPAAPAWSVVLLTEIFPSGLSPERHSVYH